MDARKKSIEIGELNSCNAQPLEKSENIEADNRQPDPFQESSSFEYRNNNGKHFSKKEQRRGTSPEKRI